MNRVVATGLGIVSSIGNNAKEVITSLREGRSGIVFMPEMQELGFRCCVYGPVKGWDPSKLRKRAKLTMSAAAQFAAGAALEALRDAGLEANDLQNERIGVIVGTAFGGINEAVRAEQLLVTRKSPSRAGATGVVKIINSTAAGNLATYLGVQGRTCSISSGCSTGLNSIGHAYELIKYGLQDVCICGATEEDCWKQVGVSCDNGLGMPRAWNDRPTQACRPYDRDHQGLVMSAGAGIVILETLEHAQRRGTRTYAEIIGYGSTNDGNDMFQPTGNGLKRAIQQALTSASERGIEKIDYINPHGAGTPIGDRVEVRVIKELFGQIPLVSSTKGLTGHGMGAAGAQEAVYTLLMLQHNFVAPTANLHNIAPECTGIRHVKTLHQGLLQTAMTFNAGLGGTNACMIFKKL
jgi:3-oxoacyl-[acyl-carrier-protein] synthase-1